MKNKFEEDLKHWYLTDWVPKNRPDYNKFDRETIWRKWNRKTLSEKWGVYVAFFDSVGIIIQDEGYWTGTEPTYSFEVRTADWFRSENYKSRQESRKAALEKAKEIYNEQQ